MTTKDSIPVVSPVFPSKEDSRNRGYFLTKVLTFCFCCLVFLPVLSSAQEDLNLESIKSFKSSCQNITNIQTQKIHFQKAGFLRFTELGEIYNPNFPKTRNMIKCSNYQMEDSKLCYLGYSYSTFRATIPINGRVGTFYSIWKGEIGITLLEYVIKKNGDYLEVTGKLYKCFSGA